jgi:hypothetical protein
MADHFIPELAFAGLGVLTDLFHTVTERFEPGVYKAVYTPLEITAQGLLTLFKSSSI